MGFLSPSVSYVFYFFNALYLRNGCPTDKSELRKRGKEGGIANFMQAID